MTSNFQAFKNQWGQPRCPSYTDLFYKWRTKSSLWTDAARMANSSLLSCCSAICRGRGSIWEVAVLKVGVLDFYPPHDSCWNKEKDGPKEKGESPHEVQGGRVEGVEHPRSHKWAQPFHTGNRGEECTCKRYKMCKIHMVREPGNNTNAATSRHGTTGADQGIIYRLDYQCFRKGYLNLFTARHILSLVKH